MISHPTTRLDIRIDVIGDLWSVLGDSGVDLGIDVDEMAIAQCGDLVGITPTIIRQS